MIKHKCENCGKEFMITFPDPVGPEGATAGVYEGGENCLYNPANGEVYPYCTKCGMVEECRPFLPLPSGEKLWGEA